MALRRTTSSSTSSSAIKRYSLNFDQYSRSSRALGGAAAAAEGDNTEEVFRNALKRMDSVLGIGVSETSTFGHESTHSKVASLCKQLQSHVLGLNGSIDPRLEIPPETREFLITWLTGDRQVSSSSLLTAGQAQRDQETLLLQVQTLERNLDTFRTENENLKKELKGRVPVHSRTGSGIAPTTGLAGGPRTPSLTALTGSTGGSLPRNISNTSTSNVGIKRQRSFRESFRKAFSRKGNSGKDITLEGDDSKPLNPRAQSFHSLTGSDLASWMSSIGLEMYAELISQLVVTGERLASIAANSEDLVRLGVLNILHCKKLKLAVEDAVAEAPSVLSYLDHHWVADWLSDVGLPQYQQPFLDAKIDGRMLNSLSMEDLAFLNIDQPFHIISMKRSIQAFRLCGYDPNYLKLRPDKGGYKLLNWSAHHILGWMRDIELDEYSDKLQGAGINGPVIALEASFTHESLAKTVGITTNKGLIIAHLGEKFLLLIGPTCAQRKVDVMQHKNFIPLNPLEQPGKVKVRKGSKRSKQSHQEETYLCPPTDVPTGIIENTEFGLRNLTVSSETGQRRSLVYSPSPVEQRAGTPVNCPTPPMIQAHKQTHLGSASNLISAPPTSVAQPVTNVPPPLAPPPLVVAPPLASVPPPPPPPPPPPMP